MNLGICATLLACLVLPVSGGTGQAARATKTAGETRCEACDLLTAAEVAAVQGEPVKDRRPSAGPPGPFAVSQCYYVVGTLSKSVVLTVYREDGSGASRRVKDFWREQFPSEAEREQGERAERSAGGDEEESAPPRRIAGVGEAAYWAGNGGVGALYVLKKESFIRISIGGADDEATKIRKSKALARKALARL